MTDLFKLDLKDFVNSLILGVLTVVLTGIIPVLETGGLPTWESLKGLLILGLTTTVANLLRKFLTTSDNTFLVGQKKDAGVQSPNQ